MTTILRSGHDCDLPPTVTTMHGTIVRCDRCGRRWRCSHPGNPDYSGWRPKPWWTCFAPRSYYARRARRRQQS